MYENISMETVLEHLGSVTATKLNERWPDVRRTHYAAKDALRKMDITTISKLYQTALQINYASLAVLTAEIIIEYDRETRRFLSARYVNVGDSLIKDVIVKELQAAFDRRQIRKGSTLVDKLGFTFLCKCHDIDYLLAKYGQELSRGHIFMGPEEWFRKTVKNTKKAPHFASTIPWAKALLNG